MRCAVALVLVSALGAGGCMPFASPPLQADAGGLFHTGRGAIREKFSVGAHLASAWHDPDLPLDVGVGYVRNGFSSRELEYEPGRVPSPRTQTGGRAVPQGIYVEARPRIARGEFWRAFVGGRVETYVANQSELVGVGVLARASIEAMYPVILQPVAGVHKKQVFFGIAHGMIAVGAYAEAGMQRWPTGESGAVFGLGVSARLPAVAGIACCALGGKKKK